MLLTLLHKTGWAQGPLKHDCLSWTVKNSLIVKTPENKEIRPLRQKLRMPLCWNSVLDLDLQHCVQKSGLPCSLTYHKGGHIYFVFYSCHVHRWVGHLSKPDSPSSKTSEWPLRHVHRYSKGQRKINMETHMLILPKRRSSYWKFGPEWYSDWECGTGDTN